MGCRALRSLSAIPPFTDPETAAQSRERLVPGQRSPRPGSILSPFTPASGSCRPGRPGSDACTQKPTSGNQPLLDPPRPTFLLTGSM